MSTFQRIGVAMFSTISLMIGGLIYNEVFVAALLPVVPTSGPFSTPITWLENLVPLILVMLLLVVWAWVVIGAVEDEKTVRRSRVR
jgi:hypothetical protein